MALLVTGPVDIGALASQLCDDIEALAFHLYPHGIVDGVEFRIGSVAGEAGRSMAIRIKGDKRGVWCDFATGETGDALDLVAAALFSGNKGSAVQWARSWLNLDAAQRGAPSRVQRPAPPKKPPKPSGDFERRRAKAMWLEGRASIADTPVERYLLGRGIDLRKLGRQPKVIRAHPHLRYRLTELYFPAMVTLITDGEGHALSVHRTYLEVRADGSVRKAPLEDPKLTLGPYRGGYIRLWRGITRDGETRPPLNQAKEGEHVIVTEGIENGLSVALACPERRIIAAVSLVNYQSLALPSCVTELTIVADNDSGAKEEAALERAIAAHQKQGRRVYVARVPIGKDANEFLNTKGTAA